MGKTPEYTIKAITKYDGINTRRIQLKFNKKTDADILNKLDNVENKQGYIKNLIRNDIKNEKKDTESNCREKDIPSTDL